jgi:hypothetical protein
VNPGDRPFSIQDLGDIIPGLGGLGDLLGGLSDIGGIVETLAKLLTPAFLKSLHDAITYLAEALRPPTPTLDRSLLMKAGPLVELLGEMQLQDPDTKGIFAALKPLLAPKTIQGLVYSLTNVEELLNTSTANVIKPLIATLGRLDIEGLLGAVEPLLTPSTVNGLVGLLHNAEELLGADTVNAINSLKQTLGKLDIGGVLRTIEPLLTPNSVNGLISLLHTMGALLNDDTINTLKPLIQTLGRIDVKGLLGAVEPLLAPNAVERPSQPAPQHGSAFERRDGQFAQAVDSNAWRDSKLKAY